jgi:hypothetical protein
MDPKCLKQTMTWVTCARSIFPNLNSKIETMPLMATHKQLQKNKDSNKKQSSKIAVKVVVKQNALKAASKVSIKKKQ